MRSDGVELISGRKWQLSLALPIYIQSRALAKTGLSRAAAEMALRSRQDEPMRGAGRVRGAQRASGCYIKIHRGSNSKKGEARTRALVNKRGRKCHRSPPAGVLVEPRTEQHRARSPLRVRPYLPSQGHFDGYWNQLRQETAVEGHHEHDWVVIGEDQRHLRELKKKQTKQTNSL